MRCSRCDHSFVVHRPSSEEGDRETASTLARDAVPTAPDPPAQPAQSETQTAASGESAESGLTDDDEDWEFGPSEADVPDAAAPPEPETPKAAKEPTPDAPTPVEPPPSEPTPPETPPVPDAPAVEAEAAPSAGTAAEAVSEGGEPPPSADRASIDDLITPEEGAERAVAASTADAPSLETDAPGEDADSAASAFDIDDPFGSSGADLSGTGTLENDDRNFEAAAADVEAQADVSAADPNADSLAALGDPSSWNLLSEEEATPDPAAMPDAPSPSEPKEPSASGSEAPNASESQPPSPAAPAPSAGAVDGGDEPLFPPTDLFSGAEASADPPASGGDFLDGFEAPADSPGEDEVPSQLFQRLGQGASWAAWPLLVLLVTAASWNLLRPEHHPPSSRYLSLENGFELRGLESRVIENALGGPLLVVSGSLRNGGSQHRALESALAVTLLDVEGHRFDEAQALMAPTPAPAALREQDPALLRGQGDHAARRLAFAPFAPGEERAFSAVFDGIPGGATRFSVDLHRLPGPPAAPPFVGPPPQPPGEGVHRAPGAVSQTGAPKANPQPIETATALPSGAPLSPE